jgi:ribulose-phosphate 3-epimerase
MIIAPSLLASDFLNLEKEVGLLEGIDNLWLHLDVMDGHFVPNLTFGHDIIRSIAKITALPLDAHFMVTNPEFYIDTLKDVALQNFTFHIEATTTPLELIAKAKSYFKSVGVSIKPGTSVEVLTNDILMAVDLVLVMSVEPGFGGQKFMPESLSKISTLKERRSRLNTAYAIQVDGGINENNAPLLWSAGADNLVAGSSVFRSSSTYQAAIQALRPII